MKNKIRIALVGNANSGKTTLFNSIVGTRRHTGNYPGVTVEKKAGKINYKGNEFNIIDLPGVYGLSADSIEEKVTLDYIINEKPEMIINVVDGSNLQRNLYLTVQLIKMDIPMVAAFNMMDEVEAKGEEVDICKLEKELEVSIIPIVANKAKGINQLLDKTVEIIQSNKEHGITCNYNSNRINNEDLMVKQRYDFIERLIEKSVKKVKPSRKVITEKIDNIILNRFLAIPIFLIFMWLTFVVTFDLVGRPLSDLLNGFIGGTFSDWVVGLLTIAGTHKWLISLITDGIIAGVGGVLVFIPQIMVLFFMLSILEDSGYMARAAFIMDKLMSKLGLNGKAFIPMILGVGCSVPGIMATRTLGNEKDRVMTSLLLPMVSCSARLPVYALLAGALFPGNESLVVMSLYLLGIIAIIISALIFKNTIFKKQSEPFIMELPPYRTPSFKTLIIDMWEKGKSFIRKAGTIIFGVSVIVWFLSSFSIGGMVGTNESFLADIGKLAAPIFIPLGFGTWEAAVSLITGITAKEVVVSTMSVLYSGLSGNSMELMTAIKSAFTPLSAYSFMVFVLLYTPCVAAIATIKKELNSWEWVFFSLGYQFALAWIVSFMIYQGGRILGFS